MILTGIDNMLKPANLLPIIAIVMQLHSASGWSQNVAVDSSQVANASGATASPKGQSQLKSTEQITRNTVQQIIFNWSMVDQIPKLIADGKLTSAQIPDPHWKAGACLACHRTDARNASARNLRKKSIEDLCVNCHDADFDHSYIHPVGVKPNDRMMQYIKRQNKKMLLNSAGQVSCASCHDLVMQCLPERRKEAGMNPRFFRGGPFETRTELCYFCHDATEYQRLNPHDQIDDHGRLRENICRVCHSGSLQALKKATDIDQVNFNVAGQLSSMCWGCHRWTPHPGGQFSFFSNKPGPDHLVKPPDNILNKMKKTSAENEIVFPLEPGSGKVFCGTCHNPHEKGVIKNKAAAKGADAKKRLRAEKICEYCHDM